MNSPALPVTPQVWAHELGASCLGHPEPTLWDDFIDGEAAAARRARRARARAICLRCPAAATCATAAAAGDAPTISGIWAGRLVGADVDAVCETCHQPYTRTRTTHRFCGKTCRRGAPADLGQRTCNECGDPFTPVNKLQRYCSVRTPRCRDVARNRRDRAGELGPRTCNECGDPFTPVNKLQRYCSVRTPRCRDVARNRERAAAARAERAAAGTPPPPTHCPPPCGAALTEEQRATRVKYHHPDCARAVTNHRAMSRRATQPAPPRPQVHCAGCPVMFTPTQALHRFHDQDCYRAHKAEQRTPSPPQPQVRCARCPVMFSPRDPRHRYHNRHCGRAARNERRAEQRAAAAPPARAQVRCARCPVMFSPRDPRHRYHNRHCATAGKNELRAARALAAAPPPPQVDRYAVKAVIHGRATLTDLPAPHRWLPVRYLRQRGGLSVRRIAQQVGAHPTTVQRILTRSA